MNNSEELFNSINNEKKNTKLKINNTRSYYKGTSFSFQSEWKEGIVFYNDEYLIDFINFNHALLVCKTTHIGSQDNIPVLIYDEDKITGIEESEYWSFVFANDVYNWSELSEEQKNEMIDAVMGTFISQETGERTDITISQAIITKLVEELASDIADIPIKIGDADNSATLGAGNTTTGDNSLVVGQDNTNTGDSAQVSGYENANTGAYADISGQFNKNSGARSFIRGVSNNNNNSEAWGTVMMLGTGLLSAAARQCLFGQYNASDASKAEVFGGGTSATARKNIRTLDWSGNQHVAGVNSQDGTPTEDNHLATKLYVDTYHTAGSGIVITELGVVSVDSTIATIESVDAQIAEIKNSTIFGIDANGNNIPHAVVIGNYAQTRWGGIAIGKSAYSRQGVSIGDSSYCYSSYGISMGCNAHSVYEGDLALGSNATAGTMYSNYPAIAIGNAATAASGQTVFSTRASKQFIIGGMANYTPTASGSVRNLGIDSSGKLVKSDLSNVYQARLLGNIEIGSSSEAYRYTDIAIGIASYARGGVAIGYYSYSLAGIAIGCRSHGGFDGIGIGTLANAHSDKSIAVGQYSHAGYRDVAIGYNAKAYGKGVAIGHNATSNMYGIAIGPCSYAAANELVLGSNYYSNMYAIYQRIKIPCLSGSGTRTLSVTNDGTLVTT